MCRKNSGKTKGVLIFLKKIVFCKHHHKRNRKCRNHSTGQYAGLPKKKKKIIDYSIEYPTKNGNERFFYGSRILCLSLK